jgi:hypothetical protein
MGKRFKGKTCVYCATAGASETGDHILAREFVPVARRSQIPQVPACRRCNKDKSDLEHYLTAVLLFGGRHADAAANLQNDGLRRLEKNQKLHRELARGRSRLWTKEPSGFLVNALTVPIDGKKVEKLIGLIARGLIWHHWEIVLGPECFVDLLSLTARDEALFQRFAEMNAIHRVKEDIGDGALVYEGAQGTDNPEVSVWKISILGGVKMTAMNDEDSTSRFGVMTGPQAIKDRADERVKRGAFILTA